MAPPLFDPQKDKPFWDAVFGLPSTAPMNWTNIRAEQAVRRLFVTELSWTHQQCERYRFRAMAQVAKAEGEVMTVRLKAPADYARDAPQVFLERLLAEMTALPLPKAQAHFEATLIPVPEIGDVMKHYRITLSDSDYALLKAAARIKGIEITVRDANTGNPALSQAIVKLVRSAYGTALDLVDG